METVEYRMSYMGFRYIGSWDENENGSSVVTHEIFDPDGRVIHPPFSSLIFPNQSQLYSFIDNLISER